MPSIITKKNIQQVINKKSPNMQRIVNIYSMGNQKKKKFILNNMSISNQRGGEDLK